MFVNPALFLRNANWLCIGLSAAVAFWLAYGYVVSVFYQQGAGILDAGWFAGLLSGSGWWLEDPVVLQDGHAGASYYRTHISPFLALASYIPLPLTPAQKIAAFLACATAVYAGLLATAMADYWTRQLPPTKLRGYLAAQTTLRIGVVVAAVVVCFNQMTVEILHFVHFELWIPVLVCAFLAAVAGQRYGLAGIVFILLISVREDAGLHLFSILILMLAVLHWRGYRNRQSTVSVFYQHRWLWGYAIASFVLSVILLFAVGRSLTDWIDDPALYFARLLAIATNYNWLLPSLVIIIWAVCVRQFVLLLGLIAFVPWCLYNALHVSPLIGNVGVYYGFPYLLAFYWVFICQRFFATAPAGKNKKPSLIKKWSPIAFAVLLVIASLPLRYQNHVLVDGGRHLRKETLASFINLAVSERTPPVSIAAVHQLHAYYLRQQSQQTIVAADGFASLFPHDVAYASLLSHGSLSELVQNDADIIIINENWTHGMAGLVVAATEAFGLWHHYRLRDSNFLLFARQALCEGEGEGGCVDGLPLVPVDDKTLGGIQRHALVSFLHTGITLHGAAIAHPDAVVVNRSVVRDSAGAVAGFSNLPIPAGRVRVLFDYQSDSTTTAPLALLRWGENEERMTLPPPQAVDAATTAIYEFTAEENVYLGVLLTNPGGIRLQANAIHITID